jgi:predicted SnoaL-like aldol condensation-catalyzing enzyme
MATKKSKRGRTATARTKTRIKRKAKAAKTGMKAKATRLLARFSAKVGVKNSAKAAAKVRAKATAKTKVLARRVSRKAAAGGHAVAEQLAHNKKLVLEFYHKLIGEKDFEAARPYMGSMYRQHAPYAADGHEGVAEWVRKFKEGFPQHHYEVKKVIAEGDFVVLHLHGKSGLHPFGESVVDIFRIEDGKVVEHWDVIQPIPESADNANSMF